MNTNDLFKINNWFLNNKQTITTKYHVYRDMIDIDKKNIEKKMLIKFTIVII